MPGRVGCPSISCPVPRKSLFQLVAVLFRKSGLESYVRTVNGEQVDRHRLLYLNVDPGVMDTDVRSLIHSSHRDDFPAVDYFIHPGRNLAAGIRLLLLC